MSDFGLFESDEAAANEPRRQARTAARKLDAAIDTVRANFGRFLLGATGIDEFEDRWHLSKNDIRASVEPMVFPNTGTMRRIQNAMKSDWKLAHPYKLAIDHDDAGFGSMPHDDGPPKNQDLDETYSPSSGNLIPEDRFESWKDSVDQGGPEKVESHVFTPGGDSGSDKHAQIDREAAMLVADIYTDFARSNGLRVASMRSLDAYASTGIAEADYRILANLIRIAEEEAEACDDEDEDTDSEAPEASESDESDSDDDEGDDYDFGGEDAAEDDTDSDGDHDHDDHHTDDEDYDFGGDEGGDDPGMGGGEQYTVPEHAPELSPEMMGEIPQGDTDGSAPVPPEVIDSLLGLPEGTIEQLLLEEVEQGQGGGDPGMSGPPMPPEGDPGMGGAPQGGGEDFLGGGGDEPEPPQDPRLARAFWAAEGDPEQESGGGGEQAAPAQDPAAAMGGGDPAAMGMQQPMMPPPGSGAVAPPAPPQQLENQPAEDALLDTANQAIMQMIDQETAEYQQIIDPLSQALQAIQFAQQVEQSEHPMDVTPPEGTVNVDPSAAPGGAQAMQQQAARRHQAGEHSFDDRIDQAYKNRGRLDESLVGVNPGDGIYRNHPGIIDGYDEGPYMGSQYGHDSASDPDFVPADYLGPAGRDMGGRHRAEARQAKVEFGIRNAAALIASRYRLSATGHQMLLNAALGRRGYEHVVEALKLVPAEVRKAAAIHMSHLFAAGNQRFNKDVFMKTVMAGTSKDRRGRHPFDSARLAAGVRQASDPRDRAWDAWASGRDRGIAEHGRHDLEDDDVDSYRDDGSFGDHLYGDYPDRAYNDDYVEEHYPGPKNYTTGSRLAGETWMNTPTKDAFEFPNAGEVPRVDDNNDTNNLPPMKGADPHGKNAASQKAVDRFQRWQKSQQQRGLPTTQGESAVHNFLQTRNPIKKRVGPEAADMIHRDLGLNPDSVKTPRAKPVKAVNPTLKGKGGKTPAAPTAKTPTPKAAPKTATWGEWEPTNQPSFFTRKVSGWRWDDHLSGYLSKEARAFTCACGQKIAAPSYKTCSCGKVWNVYAIGDSHHLASDTAEVYIAREIEVRPGVIMANRKMAGEESTWQLSENSPEKPSNPGKPKNYFATGPCGQCGGRVHDDSTFGGDPICENCLDEVYGEAGQPPPSADGWNPDDKQDPFDPRLIGANRKMAAPVRWFEDEQEDLHRQRRQEEDDADAWAEKRMNTPHRDDGAYREANRKMAGGDDYVDPYSHDEDWYGPDDRMTEQGHESWKRKFDVCPHCGGIGGIHAHTCQSEQEAQADGWNPDDKQDPFDPRLLGANRKMAAGDGMYQPKKHPHNQNRSRPAWADEDLAGYFDSFPKDERPDWLFADPPDDEYQAKYRQSHKMAKGDSGCTCWEGYERVPGTEPCASKSCRKKTGATARAQATFKQYLAEINRLAADNSGSPYNPGVGSGVIPDTKYFPTNTPGAGGIGADRVNKGGQFNDGIKIDTSNVQIDEAPPMPDKTIGVGVDGFGKPDNSAGVGRMNSDNTLFGGGGSFGDASTATPQPPSGFNGTPSLLPGKTAYADNLAMIEKLADWTKYDSPDPSRDPKAKPPSTKIKSQPGDWTNRDFTGPTKGQWREPDPTELPRKTRKKK